jgi:hypothetical protein
VNPHDDLPPGTRCCHCGTTAEHHAQSPQPCPGILRGETLRPEPERHQYASEDYDFIGRRLAELDAERTEAMNTPAKE